MFFCDKCAEKNGWTKSFLFKSHGLCEICNETAVCNDVPSKFLVPSEKKSKNEEIVDDDCKDELCQSGIMQCSKCKR